MINYKKVLALLFFVYLISYLPYYLFRFHTKSYELFNAVNTNNISKAQKILHSGVNPNWQVPKINDGGFFSEIYSLQNGIVYILNKDRGHLGSEGTRLISYVRSRDMIDMLLEYGADPYMAASYESQHPLAYLVYDDDDKTLLKYVLSKNTDEKKLLEYYCTYGRFPFSIYKNDELFVHLANNWKDVNMVSSCGETIKSIAISNKIVADGPYHDDMHQ